MPTSLFVWVMRNPTTVRHIRGLLEGLDKVEALAFGEIRIMPVDVDTAVELPPGMRDWNGHPIKGRLITYDSLPAEGLLLVADD